MNYELRWKDVEVVDVQFVHMTNEGKFIGRFAVLM